MINRDEIYILFFGFLYNNNISISFNMSVYERYDLCLGTSYKSIKFGDLQIKEKNDREYKIQYIKNRFGEKIDLKNFFS